MASASVDGDGLYESVSLVICEFNNCWEDCFITGILSGMVIFLLIDGDWVVSDCVCPLVFSVVVG